jgi:hypothetical protein
VFGSGDFYTDMVAMYFYTNMAAWGDEDHERVLLYLANTFSLMSLR